MKITSLMKQFGREMSLHLPDGWTSGTYCGFIQPLRYKNKMYLDGVNTQIGFNNQGHYLYMGPPEHDLTVLSSTAWLLAENIKYKIDRAEKVYNGKEVFYVWAIVRTIVEID